MQRGGVGYKFKRWSRVFAMEGEDWEGPAPEAVPVPPVGLALSPSAAAHLLGIPLADFTEEIQPYVRVVMIDGRLLIPVRELERWLQGSAGELL